MGKLSHTSTNKQQVDKINELDERVVDDFGDIYEITSTDDGFEIEFETGKKILLPVKAGDGIVVDVGEDDKSIEIHTDGGGGGGLYLHKIRVDIEDGDYFILNCINNSNTTISTYGEIAINMEKMMLTGKCHLSFISVPGVHLEYILTGIWDNNGTIEYSAMKRTDPSGQWSAMAGLTLAPASITDTVTEL